MAPSSARSRLYEAGAGTPRSDARLPPNIGQCHPRIASTYFPAPGHPTCHSPALRFGTVALCRQISMLRGVNVAGPSPAAPERDLAAHRIGLVASSGEAAKAAEAMLRRRYKWT